MAPDTPPAWLDEGQAESFRRLLHLLRRAGAALCADPVGSGKTYVALAVAQALAVGEPCCIIPPTILHQWHSVARRLGVPITTWSHAKLSRGAHPAGNPRLVIVDESHHFRHPGIRRYVTLAPWLVGRKLLLLSATAVVNGPVDLYHQLHLGLRDDVLAGDGSPSIRLAFARGTVPPALGRYLVERASTVGRPAACATDLALASGALPVVPALDDLGLSGEPTVAALLRSVFLRAAASSSAALHGVLIRYRHLLLHARDAAAVGHAPLRRGLRDLLGGDSSQLQLWGMLSPVAAGDALRVEELPLLDRLLAELRPCIEKEDGKVTWLRSILRDQVPTLVFVSSVDTAHYLRRLLPEPWLAWCTGHRSGIGRVSLPRGDVLAWFRPGAPDVPGRPRTLISTDVGAEGLDLQRAERVVHYDLPWTEVRLAQRDGRAIRLGSTATVVQVHRILPPAAIEFRLRQESILLRKAGLPAACGLGDGGRARWRWRRELAAATTGPATPGVAAVRCESAGWLAGIVIEGDSGPLTAAALWRSADGEWTDEPAVISARLLHALEAEAVAPPDPTEVAAVVSDLEPVVRGMLRAASLHRHEGAPPTAASRALALRLRHLAASAARNRDRALLARLELAMAFATGGHTAGEEAVIAELVRLADEELLLRLPTLPTATPPPGPFAPRLVGLIAFVGDPVACQS